MNDPNILQRLLDMGYRKPKFLVDGRWAAILPLMYHSAVVSGTVREIDIGYSDRWCFDNNVVDKCYDSWDGTGEPMGWHRHPDTGRRRENGDPDKEYIQW